MSNVAIYNGFGQYESTPYGEKGITLTHGGVPFWLPFNKVSYIPDFTMREIDHDASTANGEEEGRLQYKTFRISGERIAEELLQTQIPTPNHDKGIIVIANEKDKRKNTYATVYAGMGDDGRPITVEVQEITPTEFEVAESKRLALAYKQEVIQNYFQGKRERIMGNHGFPVIPTGLVKTFMAELGVKDMDDVSKQLETAAAATGMTPEMFLLAMKEILAANKGPTEAPKGPKGKQLEESPV